MPHHHCLSAKAGHVSKAAEQRVGAKLQPAPSKSTILWKPQIRIMVCFAWQRLSVSCADKLKNEVVKIMKLEECFFSFSPAAF